MKTLDLFFLLDSIFKYAKKSILFEYRIGRITDLECIASLESIKVLETRCSKNAYRDKELRDIAKRIGE